MPQMRKLKWAKLKSPFSRAGKLPKESYSNNLSSKLEVEEEYREAFRTKSYEEILTKVEEEQLRKSRIDPGNDRLSSSSSSLSLPFYVHLADQLSEPQRDTLKEMVESLQCHHLLSDYFEANLDACDFCDLLLRSIHQTRSDYKKLGRAFRLGERAEDPEGYSDKIREAVLGELAAYALKRNPLSSPGPMQFREFHVSNLVLLNKLTSETRRIRRRVKFNRFCKKIAGYGLVISNMALVVVVLVLAIHSMVGIVATPALVTHSLYFFRKRVNEIGGSRLPVRVSLLVRLCMQLDLASRGTYILINDFETIGVLVRRLYDEIDHWKALADMCVRSKNADLLKEVVMEFYLRESSYLEQLEELERHVYLCFNMIDRSRKLVIQEITAAN